MAAPLEMGDLKPAEVVKEAELEDVLQAVVALQPVPPPSATSTTNTTTNSIITNTNTITNTNNNNNDPLLLDNSNHSADRKTDPPSAANTAAPTSEEDNMDFYSEDDDDDSKSNHSSSNQDTHKRRLKGDIQRSHHNVLERKRRDLIKESFAKLRDSVPTLTSERASRAQILKKAADFIQITHQKNESTRNNIKELVRKNMELESVMLNGGAGKKELEVKQEKVD